MQQLETAVQQTRAEKLRVDDLACATRERREMRKRVLQTVLYYRARGELSEEKWRVLLDPDFQLTIPVTPFSRHTPFSVDSLSVDVFEGKKSPTFFFFLNNTRLG